MLSVRAGNVHVQMRERCIFIVRLGCSKGEILNRRPFFLLGLLWNLSVELVSLRIADLNLSEWRFAAEGWIAIILHIHIFWMRVICRNEMQYQFAFFFIRQKRHIDVMSTATECSILVEGGESEEERLLGNERGISVGTFVRAQPRANLFAKCNSNSFKPCKLRGLLNTRKLAILASTTTRENEAMKALI